MRVIGQPAAIVREEFLSQAEDFVGLADGLVDPRVDDIGGEPGLLGSPGAVAEPRVFDGVIHDPLFGGTARHQAGRPVRSPILERLRIFVQQHQRRGPHAVLDGVELRARLSLLQFAGHNSVIAFRRFASSLASETAMGSTPLSVGLLPRGK